MNTLVGDGALSELMDIARLAYIYGLHHLRGRPPALSGRARACPARAGRCASTRSCTPERSARRRPPTSPPSTATRCCRGPGSTLPAARYFGLPDTADRYYRAPRPDGRLHQQFPRCWGGAPGRLAAPVPARRPAIGRAAAARHRPSGRPRPPSGRWFEFSSTDRPTSRRCMCLANSGSTVDFR